MDTLYVLITVVFDKYIFDFLSIKSTDNTYINSNKWIAVNVKSNDFFLLYLFINTEMKKKNIMRSEIHVPCISLWLKIFRNSHMILKISCKRITFPIGIVFLWDKKIKGIYLTCRVSNMDFFTKRMQKCHHGNCSFKSVSISFE